MRVAMNMHRFCPFRMHLFRCYLAIIDAVVAFSYAHVQRVSLHAKKRAADLVELSYVCFSYLCSAGHSRNIDRSSRLDGGKDGGQFFLGCHVCDSFSVVAMLPRRAGARGLGGDVQVEFNCAVFCIPPRRFRAAFANVTRAVGGNMYSVIANWLSSAKGYKHSMRFFNNVPFPVV